jgi:aminopeptidase N
MHEFFSEKIFSESPPCNAAESGVNPNVIDAACAFKEPRPMCSRMLARLTCLLLLLAAMSPPATLADAPFAFDTTPGRLPKTVVPRHYAIRLEPDLDKFITRGSMTVDLEVRQPVAEIVLNALDLDVTRASLVADRETPLEINQNPDKQLVTLKLPAPIGPGRCRLALEFTGRLTEHAQGLFYVRYAAPSGKKIMLATQMEPADARRMFPCWDEPVFRATYDLTVVVPQKHLAVSNMPVESETNLSNGLKEVKFMRTPPMASYLVVLVSGELEELKGEAAGVKIRVITTEGKREQARYALAVTEKVLPYYNRYFGIRYPLPKLDQIAVPGGFDGAMENWGGITYNESMLLFDPQTSSQQTRRDIFVTVAHEMAHQWFGNLVTMAWWDNLWLNEGFASWMENKATDHFNPDWEMWLAAGLEKSGVMSQDARKTTHAVQSAVNNESEADDSFDNITYIKGQAFLQMLENYLGEAQFRKGIHRYLAAHEYSNTTTADLWSALEKSSGKPVAALSAGWTEQPGLPVVIVKSDCTGGRQIVTLTQKRFTVGDPDAQSLSWTIPVAWFNTARPASARHTLLQNTPVTITLPDCSDAIKLNAGDFGYYRVSYEPAWYRKVKIAGLPPTDQLGLLSDTWAMVEAGRASSTNYLALVEALPSAKTYAVWSHIISVLELLDGLEQNQPGRVKFQQYARLLLQPQWQRLGWSPHPGEPVGDALRRSQILGTLGRFGDSAVIAEARARFDQFLARPETLPADLRPSVLNIVGRYSDRKTYGELHELARNAKGTEEREMDYRALAGALDPVLAQVTLDLSLTDETVPQEASDLVAQVAGSGEQTELAWKFTQQHLKELLAKVDSFNRNDYVPSIVASCSDAARANELKAFVAANVSTDAAAKANETAEDILFKAALKQRELPPIDRWVEAAAQR